MQVDIVDYPTKINSCSKNDDLFILSYYNRDKQDVKDIGSRLIQLMNENPRKDITYKKETILDIVYFDEPQYRSRKINDGDEDVVIDYKTYYSLRDDKRKYPSIFDNEFVIAIKTNLRCFYFPVYKRYRWNNADILGVIQIIAMCSKDDRRVLLASGMHDFMLDYAQLCLNTIRQCKDCESMSVNEYIWLTSRIFEFNTASQGMSKLQSKIMSSAVQIFQSTFNRKHLWNKVN